MRLRRAAVAAVVMGTGLALGLGAGGAAAAPATNHVVQTLPGGWVGPLQFAVSDHGVVVADSFQSALFRVGKSKPIARGPAPSPNPEVSGDLAGVDVDKGYIAYTTSTGDHSVTKLTVRKHGRTVMTADLSGYEKKANPDGGVQYGATDPSAVSKACAKEIKAGGGAPVSYKGIVDSHPYAVAGLHDGTWLVADAGGNDILRVDAHGNVSTFAVLPPQPVTITAALAKQLKAPHCVGITYRFEAVPTDVEYANGRVWVSTLPGGEAGPGSVYTVGWDGGVQLITTGYPLATNIAITENGGVYVVSLGDGIWTPDRNGKPHRVAKLKGAVAAEWVHGRLYASTAPALVGGKGLGRIVIMG
jgi:hypothetical protein